MASCPWPGICSVTRTVPSPVPAGAARAGGEVRTGARGGWRAAREGAGKAAGGGKALDCLGKGEMLLKLGFQDLDLAGSGAELLVGRALANAG